MVYRVLLFVLLLLANFTSAQWSNDPTINTPICQASDNQGNPKIINDGQGGSIIVWEDKRNQDYSLYAQRLNANGIAMWETDGVLVNTVPNARYDNFQAISDGNGGIIVTWEEDGSGNDRVFAQRLNSNGIMQWAPNGILICTTMSVSPELIEDGFGGAIITWEDWRISGDQNIFAQRINSDGVEQWTINGIAVCSAINNQKRSKIINDGSNGAIIIWRDHRNSMDDDIYAQRIDASGNSQWTSNGVPVCTSSSNQSVFSLVSDNNGGAIIAWSEYLTSSNDYDIYTQRINSSGIIQWPSSGIPIDTSESFTYGVEISPDGNGGAIMCWERDDFNQHQIFAQRINSSGNLLWDLDGVLVCFESGSREGSEIISDNAGGAIVTWSDDRNGELNSDIYAQRISNSGQVNWILNGIAVSIADSGQSNPSIIENGYGGAIISWTDGRNLDSDIYAQKINSDGSLGGTSSVQEESMISDYRILQNYPNPFNPNTVIMYQIPELTFVTLKIYDVLGNEIETLVNEEKPAGSYEAIFNGYGLPNGIYFYKIVAGKFIDTKKMVLLK